MKPTNTFLAILIVGMVISCKSRSIKDHANADSSDTEASSSQVNQSNATDESLEKKLHDKSWRRKPAAVKDIRSDVLEVASTKGEPPMKIVASLIMSDQHDVERLVFLLEAFKETEMQMDLVTRLPAIGTPRRIVVQCLVRRFESAKDTKGLLRLYESLSPGADRNDVGTARARMAIQEAGLVAGLEVIRKLERSTEKYAAAIQTRDAWLPHVREREIKSKLDEIAASIDSPMDSQYKGYLSLMVENALRKN